MSFYIIIPARFGSNRLPGKPLKDIAGKPMIQWVYEAAQKSAAKHVVVATDDQRIADVVTAFGGNVCLTSAEHPSGTDRLQEVVTQLGLEDNEIVVNVQGDEPLIPAAVINQVAADLANNPNSSMATLSEPILDVEDCLNPNVVKVVSNKSHNALYFSRAAIPWNRDTYSSDSPALPSAKLAQRHIGIYAYRVSLLHKFVTWPMAALESVEKLEQLRVLENGEQIYISPACEYVPGGIDTEQDLLRVQALLTNVSESQ